MTTKLPAKYALPKTGVARLIAVTQVHEDYGSPNEPYWKPKFGSDYCIAEAGACLFGAETAARSKALVEEARPLIEADSAMLYEVIIDWYWTEPGEATEAERMELEYEGGLKTGAISVEWLRAVSAEQAKAGA